MFWMRFSQDYVNIVPLFLRAFIISIGNIVSFFLFNLYRMGALKNFVCLFFSLFLGAGRGAQNGVSL